MAWKRSGVRISYAPPHKTPSHRSSSFAAAELALTLLCAGRSQPVKAVAWSRHVPRGRAARADPEHLPDDGRRAHPWAGLPHTDQDPDGDYGDNIRDKPSDVPTQDFWRASLQMATPQCGPRQKRQDDVVVQAIGAVLLGTSSMFCGVSDFDGRPTRPVGTLRTSTTFRETKSRAIARRTDRAKNP